MLEFSLWVKYKKIGEGWEHEVFTFNHEGWVLKKPKARVLIIMALTGFGASKLREEYQIAEWEASKTSGIKIPKTRVFDTRKLFGLSRYGYLIAQKRIEEDGSVGDMRQVLHNQESRFFADVYDSTLKPTRGNFIASQGLVYCVDPSHSYNRLMERFMGLSFSQIIRVKAFAFKQLGLN